MSSSFKSFCLPVYSCQQTFDLTGLPTPSKHIIKKKKKLVFAHCKLLKSTYKYVKQNKELAQNINVSCI